MSTLKPKPEVHLRNLTENVELSWSDSELPLCEFLKRFKPPQIVQIAEGTYGEDEERTLSQGQELNLHLLKDTKCYAGITSNDEKIHVPLNSTRKVHVYAEEDIEYKSIDDLCAQFPKKYKHIRLTRSQNNPSNQTEMLKAGTVLEAVYFDRDNQCLICLDKGGCEVSFEPRRFTGATSGMKALRKCSRECVFIGEVPHHFSLPVTVQFVQEKNGERVPRGLVNLQKIVVNQTVIATARDIDVKSILTFSSTLDVTVIAPLQAVGENPDPTYQSVCELLNKRLDLEKVGKSIETNEEIYDDVRHNSGIMAIPYAEAFFGSRANLLETNNNATQPDSQTTTTIDTVGYIKMDGGNALNKDIAPGPGDVGYDSDNYIKVDESSSDSSENYEEMEPSMLSKSLPGRIDPPKKQKKLMKIMSIPQTGKKFGKPSSWFSFKKKSKSTSSFDSPTSPASSCSSSYLGENTNKLAFRKVTEEELYGPDDEDTYECPDFKAGSLPPLPLEKPHSDDKTYVIPAYKKAEQLTIQEVTRLLGDLNLGQYKEVFENEQVDGRILVDLDKDVLTSHFKMTSFHAHKLIKATMENWRPTVDDQ